MKLFKTASLATLGLAAVLTLSACSGSTSPTTTASATAVSADQKTVGTTVATFFNHFFALSNANRDKIIAGIPAAALQIDEEGNLIITDAQAAKYAKLMETADPEFATLDTASMTPTQKYTVYLSFLALSAQVPAGTKAVVTNSKIKVTGDSATVPAAAVTYRVNGENYPSSSGGDEGGLKKVNGKWLIEANLSSN